MTSDVSELNSLEVVIMDDDETSLRFLRGALKNLGVKRVYTANSADKVLYYAEKRHQKHFILDIRLDSDRTEEGLDALERLKEVDEDIFVAMLSGYPDIYRKKAKRLGADVFQPKSAHRGVDVLAIVDKMLTRKANDSSMSKEGGNTSEGTKESLHQLVEEVVNSTQAMTQTERQLEQLQVNKVFTHKVALEDLVARLLQMKEGARENFWWLGQICSNAITISKEFTGARSYQEFFYENIADSTEINVELDLQYEPQMTITQLPIAIMALYPSSAVRSVSAHVSMHNKRAHAVVRDPLLLLDPNELQPENNITSFTAKVTLFAVCLE